MAAVTLATTILATTILAATILATTILVAPAAQAATGYRYWAYYLASGGTWSYSQRGPAFEHPVDGEVQGWRFAVQSSGSPALAPRYRPDFAVLCASTPVQPGRLRVGIVIDFGVAADAPPGEQPPGGVVTGCVRVPVGSTGMDVLDAAVGAGNVRIGTGRDAGLVCGVSGYPKAECAVAATSRPVTAGATSSTHTTSATPTRVAATLTPATSPTPTPAPSSAPTSLAPGPSSAAAVQAPGSAPPAASTLADLSRHRGGGFPTGTVVGGAIVVLLGIGAAWRARAGRR